MIEIASIIAPKRYAQVGSGTEINRRREPIGDVGWCGKHVWAGGLELRHLASVFFFQAEDGIRDVAVTGVQTCALPILSGLDHLVVQDIFRTKTAEMANVVLPASASWCEAEGTVTNSERRVQRVRRAIEPPGDARDDIWIICAIARRLGKNFGHPTAEDAWNEMRSLAPMFAGMSYKRLEDCNGIHWPCFDENHPGQQFLHARFWNDPPEGKLAPFHAVEHEGPVEQPDEEYPFILTTGRRLESFNTGVQSGGYDSPLHYGESVDIAPEDAERLDIADGDVMRISSRRGSVEAPARVDYALKPGLVFMTLHFPDQVPTNFLTIDEFDPKSGTAEFKACAVRLEKARVKTNGKPGSGKRQPSALAGD